MTRVALQRSRHEHLRWRQPGQCLHVAHLNFCNVLLAETAQVLSQHVLAFVSSSRGYQVGAVLGLGAGNDYVTPQGQWLGGYLPAVIRAFPFGQLQTQEGQKVLAIDKACLTDEPDGKPLFEDGALSAEVLGIQRHIAQCENNQALTDRAVSLLHEHHLLTPWTPKLRSGTDDANPADVSLKGLYQVNEAALQELPGVALEKLNAAGALKLAHAQRFSAVNWAQLVKRRSILQQPQAPATSDRLGKELSRLLGNDDELTFD